MYKHNERFVLTVIGSLVDDKRMKAPSSLGQNLYAFEPNMIISRYIGAWLSCIQLKQSPTHKGSIGHVMLHNFSIQLYTWLYNCLQKREALPLFIWLEAQGFKFFSHLSDLKLRAHQEVITTQCRNQEIPNTLADLNLNLQCHGGYIYDAGKWLTF